MTSGDKADVEAALESINGNKKATLHLRRFLGLETQYDEINGHIFRTDSEERDGTSGWCLVGSCEMSTREYAGDHDCPTPLEAYDFKTNEGF